MDNLPRRGHNEQRWMFWKRRRHLVTFLAFLGFFTVNILRVNFFNAINPMITPYNVTLDNGTVVEKQDVTWNFWEIFTILRAFIFGNAATQILGGWLGACLGGSRVFGVAVALSALISLVTPFLVNTDVVNILIAIRLIEGLFAGVTYPSIIAVWSRWAPPQERTRLVTIAFSGSFFSTVVTPPVCRFIANTLGWPYIFYISGIIGLIWFVVWWTVVKDKPEDDPHISTEELKYLRDNLDSGPNDYIPKHIIYPWDKFVTSMPVWAIVVAHTCMSWGLIVLELDLPVFMRDAYNYKVDQTGLMSFLPVLLMAVLMPVAGVLADWLRNTEVLTTTQVLKVFNCGTFISQAILILLAGNLNSVNGVLLCQVMAILLSAFSRAAMSVNHLDIAPQHASVLMGLSNTFACVIGLLSPLLTDYIVKERTVEQWQYMFYLIIAVYLVGALLYWAFASAERQRWAPPAPTPESESLSLPQRSHVI
ncbi:vesicular glutamate transporter 1-like [Homalodisca vitripennis]|uniref:vesicular glutamate transporter 1-like n=1 Tax=Homalodisca vitripennis TaxID=197043 RepID=UPI001EECDA1A|nr:vesicular glutamate transporter 1-like [Homalodisca vitripennis]